MEKKNSTVVVNRREEKYDVDIGRGSKWGNPFVVGEDGNRTQVIIKYEEWIRKQAHLLAALSELVNKRLGCYCWPKACHGEVLIKLLIEFGMIEQVEDEEDFSWE